MLVAAESDPGRDTLLASVWADPGMSNTELAQEDKCPPELF
jgi:hypothetical protein